MVLPVERAVEPYQLTPVLIVHSAGGELLYDNMLYCVSYDNDDNESTLTFRLSRADPKADNIKEEMPVQFKGRNYRVRTITIEEDFESGESSVEVYCERLWYDLIYAGQFDAQWVSATARALMIQAVSGSGWAVGQVDTTSTIGWDTEAGTALNFLQQISKIYGGYLVFDDQTKQVHLLSEANAGRDRGTSFTYYRGIRSATRKSDTSSLVTRLYGRNAEGVTIASANGGVPYVSNYSWTTAVRSAVYDFKAGMTPEAMLRYLNSILVARSTPNLSYKFSVSGLMDRLDEVDRFEVLDTVFVQDKDFKNSIKNKVVSLTIDYLDLRRSKIELGNRMRSLSNSGNTTNPKNEPPALVRKPAVPTSVTTSSFVYFLPGGEPRAELSVTFVPAELGTDNQPIAITAHQLLGRRVVTPEENFKVIAQAPGSPHEIIAQDFIPGDPWEFKVRAVASNGVASASSASVFHSFGTDTIPPPAPSKPILTTKLGTVTVRWDGKNNIGGEMPVDTAWIEVMQGPGPVGTSIASITAGEGNNFHVITGLPYNQPVTIWFRAVDTSGNISANSLSETISTVPLVDTDLIGRVIADANIKLGAVKAELIADGAVLQDKLADNAVSLEKLDGLTREKIENASEDATLANGRLTTSTSAPTTQSGAGKPVGAIWYRYNSAGTLLGTWRWNGTAWDAQAWGQDAIAAGAIVESKLDTAIRDAITQASTDADTALVAANGKNRIVYSTSAAVGTTDPVSGYAYIDGDTWFQRVGGVIIGQWQFGSGAWGVRTLDNAVIANLDAGKLTAGFISSARIDVKSITAEKLVLGNFENLFPNGAFTQGTLGWSSAGGLEAVDITDGPNGAPVSGIRVSPTAADQGVASSAYPFNAVTGTPYTPGATYAFRMVARRVSGTGGVIRIRIGLHGIGLSNSWITIPSLEMTGVAGQWVTLTGTYTTPAASGRDKLSAAVHLSGAAGSVFEFSEVSMRIMADAQLIVDGSVSARQMVTGTITAESGILANASVGTAQIANLAVTDAKIATLDAAKISTGFLDAARIDANTITSRMIAIGDFTNLVSGSDFETPALIPWNIDAAAGWAVGATNLAHSGARVLQATGSSGNTLRTFQGSIPVQAGDRYYVEFWARRSTDWNGTTANSKLRIGYSGGGVSAISYAATDFSAGTWVKRTGEFVIPEGSTSMDITLVKDSTAGWLYIDDIVVRRMFTGELIVDGSIIAQHLATNSVTSDKVFANAITTAKIATNAVTANEIAALTIVAGNIASNAITTAKIAALQIEAGHIKTNAITADKILAGAITAVKIDTDAITSTKISATAITSKHTITGAKIQTTTTANRGIEITNAGLTAYNSSGTPTVFIDAASGGATFTGTIRNQVSGPRVQINSNDSRGIVWFYTGTAGSQSAQISSDPDGEGLLLYGGALAGGVRRATLQLREQGANSVASWYLGQMPANGSSVEPMGYMEYTSSTWLKLARTAEHMVELRSDGTTQFRGGGVAVYGNFATHNGTKNFIMDHPDTEGKSLVHASTESPHNGVEYWSDGFVEVPASGVAVVELPEYFESLTATDHRVPVLTAGSAGADLWAEPISGGKLVVHGAPHALFSWVVKARRIRLDSSGADTLAFEVEPKLENAQVDLYDPTVGQ